MDSELAERIRAHFDFLIRECGFSFTSSSRYVRYDAPDLYVEIWLGGGDTDLLVGLKRDTETIRPGTTHLFTFQQLLRHFNERPVPLLQEFPRSPGVTDEEHTVRYFAHWVKKDLLDLLKGDLSLLDGIFQ